MTDSPLHLIPAAKADLQEIWHYTVDTWGEAQAERYVAELKRTCYQLMEAPSLGKPALDVGDGVRVYRCQHHYIFYLEEKDHSIFLAFIHERRDILRHVVSRLP